MPYRQSIKARQTQETCNRVHFNFSYFPLLFMLFYLFALKTPLKRLSMIHHMAVNLA